MAVDTFVVLKYRIKTEYGSKLTAASRMESTRVVLFSLFIMFFIHVRASTFSFPGEALPTKSGYLPVSPTSKSAMFYCFYEAQRPISSLSQTPLLVWLQGGPGCSSMIGNFFELGPWRVNFHRNEGEPLRLELNSGSWNRMFGLLFLDNPIGTGFSIASSEQEIPRNQLSVAKHLFTAITSFVGSNPLFKNRPIYFTGESYAGKYVPAIAYYILKTNPQLPASKRLALAGVAIGNGLTDPIIQVATHADNAYFTGLINKKQKMELEDLQNEAVRLVKIGNWSQAREARTKILIVLQNMTGLATLYDYTKKSDYKTEMVTELMATATARTALKVEESIVFEECSNLVGSLLREDVMKSVKFMVEYLVKNSKVLLYQGLYDLRDGVVSTEAWMKTMKWEGIEEFMSAERKVWRVNGEVAGYVQKWRNLSHAVVSGGGHLLPADQPLNSQAMIEDWVMEKGVWGNDYRGEESKSQVLHGSV